MCSKEHLGSSSQPQRHQANGAPLCHRARGARWLAAIHCLGHRGLPPLGIAPLALAAPSQCHQLSPLPALCTTVSEHRPVQCTGPDRRGGGRSLSRRRPESLAAAPRGRRVQPAPTPGSGATIHHRALPRKESFLPLQFTYTLRRTSTPLVVPTQHFPRKTNEESAFENADGEKRKSKRFPHSTLQ